MFILRATNANPSVLTVSPERESTVKKPRADFPHHHQVNYDHFTDSVRQHS